MKSTFLVVFALLAVTQAAGANTVNWSCSLDATAYSNNEDKLSDDISLCTEEAFTALQTAGCNVDENKAESKAKPRGGRHLLLEMKTISSNCESHTVKIIPVEKTESIMFQYSCPSGFKLKDLSLDRDAKPIFGSNGGNVICIK